MHAVCRAPVSRLAAAAQAADAAAVRAERDSARRAGGGTRPPRPLHGAESDFLHYAPEMALRLARIQVLYPRHASRARLTRVMHEYIQSGAAGSAHRPQDAPGWLAHQSLPTPPWCPDGSIWPGAGAWQAPSGWQGPPSWQVLSGCPGGPACPRRSADPFGPGWQAGASRPSWLAWAGGSSWQAAPLWSALSGTWHGRGRDRDRGGAHGGADPDGSTWFADQFTASVRENMGDVGSVSMQADSGGGSAAGGGGGGW